MLSIMKHSIHCDLASSMLIKWFASIRIDVKSWKIAARNVDSDAMASFENI